MKSGEDIKRQVSVVTAAQSEIFELLLNGKLNKNAFRSHIEGLLVIAPAILTR